MIFNKLWDCTGHAGAVYSIDTDQKNFVYSASADKYVVRWNLSNGQQDPFAIRFETTPYAIKLFKNNQFLAVGLANGDLHIFDLHTKSEVKFYKQHKAGIFSIYQNEITKHLYVGDAEGNFSVWNTDTLELVILQPLNCGKIRRFSTSQDGQVIYLGGQDGMLRVIDAVTFNELNSIVAHREGVTSILSLSENLLLTAGKDAHLALWDTTTWFKIKSIPAHNYVVYELKRLSDNLFISGSRDKSIKVWDTNELKVLQKLDRKAGAHKHSVNSIAVIDQDHFISASDDGKLILWTTSR